MAHFAQIDKDGVVTRVVVATQDFIDTGRLGDPKSFVQTSYNTQGGKYYDPVTRKESTVRQLRKNYAGVGYIYDKDIDAFVPPKTDKEDIFDVEKSRWISIKEDAYNVENKES